MPGLVKGLQVLPLHNFEHENTALVKWDKIYSLIFHQHFGGEEILFLTEHSMMNLEVIQN